MKHIERLRRLRKTLVCGIGISVLQGGMVSKGEVPIAGAYLLERGIARHVEDFVIVDVDLLLEGAHLYNLYSNMQHQNIFRIAIL